MTCRSRISNVTLVTLIAAGALTCQKKSSGTSSEGSQKIPAATVAPVATSSGNPAPPPNPEVTQGPSGGAGDVRTKASFAVPPASTTTLTKPFLQSYMPELTKFVHLQSPLFSNLGVTLSDLQQKSSDCANSFMKTALIKATATGFGVEGGQDFVACLGATAPKMSSAETRNWQSTLSWSFRANCADHSFTVENGLSLGHDDLVRHLCQTASSGELYLHLEFEAKELGDGGKVISTLKRTKAILGNTGTTCNFVRDPLTGARSYQDCLQFEKIERDGAVPFYAEALFSKDKSVGNFDAKGIRFSVNSQVDVKVNNWAGTVTFAADPKDLPSITLADGTSTFEGKGAFPFPIEYKDDSKIYILAPTAPTQSNGPTSASSPTTSSTPVQSPTNALTPAETPSASVTPAK